LKEKIELPLMSNAPNLQLTQYIRDIPDFPKPGILFRDITPLLAAPEAFRRAIVDMVNPFRREKVDVVAAAEARGFIFAAPMALELNAAFVPIRKPGKLPFEIQSLTYDLEYGTDTLEIHSDAMFSGARVLMVDDLLATGGTMDACCQLVEKVGGVVAGCAFLIELAALQGAERLSRYKTISLIKYD
jgi:adenine phosphoribosyltransferase